MLVECLETSQGRTVATGQVLRLKNGQPVGEGQWARCGGKTKWIPLDTEGLHEIEEREEYSVILKGKPGEQEGT